MFFFFPFGEYMFRINTNLLFVIDGCKSTNDKHCFGNKLVALVFIRGGCNKGDTVCLGGFTINFFSVHPVYGMSLQLFAK